MVHGMPDIRPIVAARRMREVNGYPAPTFWWPTAQWSFAPLYSRYTLGEREVRRDRRIQARTR